MGLDPTSQLFKDAVAITGWPDGLRQPPLSFQYSRERWQLRGDGGWCERCKDVHYVWNAIEDSVAEALLEHHFRVWLEGGEISMWLVIPGPGEIPSESAYQARKHQYRGGLVAEADSYLECQMKAVVEIDSRAKVKK